MTHGLSTGERALAHAKRQLAGAVIGSNKVGGWFPASISSSMLRREPWGAVTYWANFLLECPDHAAARLLQRAPHADLNAALSYHMRRSVFSIIRRTHGASAQNVFGLIGGATFCCTSLGCTTLS